MKIYNKIESSTMIEQLNLNRFPEKIFNSGEDEKVLEFIDRFPAKYYAIRDKTKAGGVAKFKVEKKDILNEIKEYSLFSINVSSFNYTQNQLMVGEILISNSNISLIYSTNKNYSLRDAYKDPDQNINTDIFNNKTLETIPHFNEIYEFIAKNELQNVIVEFALFDKEVGINNEKIIIYELRTDY